jgi:hypothetical protein
VLMVAKLASQAATVEAWESEPIVFAVAAVVVVSAADPLVVGPFDVGLFAMAIVTMTPRMMTTISVESMATPLSDRFDCAGVFAMSTARVLYPAGESMLERVT